MLNWFKIIRMLILWYYIINFKKNYILIAKNLLYKMLQSNWKYRISSSDALNNIFFKLKKLHKKDSNIW